MARPKNPEKLLKEALEKGDLEGAKKALVQIEINKKKNKKEKPIQIQKPVKTQKQISKEPKNDEEKRAYGAEVKIGIDKNKFNPKEFSSLKFKEDKNIHKKFSVSERDRPGIDITEVQVICDNCKNKFTTEAWDVRKRKPGDDDSEEPENLCKKCIRRIFRD